MTEWQTAVNIDSCSILKKIKLILQGRFFRKYNKNNTFMSKKYPEEVEQNCLYKVCEKNADIIYADIVLICMYFSDITSKPWQINVQLMESSIKNLTFDICWRDRFIFKLIIVFVKRKIKGTMQYLIFDFFNINVNVNMADMNALCK